MNAQAAVEALLVLHQPGTVKVWNDRGLVDRQPVCLICGVGSGWPCDTVKILNEVTA